MFQIGELARIAGVSLRTLRHYDALGLLSPGRRDSGYRSYGAADLERLRRILTLRDLGFSLDHIGAVLGRPQEPGLEQGAYLALLAQHRSVLLGELAQTQARLERLGHLLQEASMNSAYQPELRPVPSQRVAAATGTATSYKAVTAPMNRLFDQAEKHLKAAGGRSSGPCLVLWHADYGHDEAFTLECLIPFEGDVVAGDGVQVYTLPETPEMAVVLHRGSYERLGEAYAALTAFVEEQHYERTGPLREVYLHAAPREEDHLTEIHLPVRRRAEAD